MVLNCLLLLLMLFCIVVCFNSVGLVFCFFCFCYFVLVFVCLLFSVSYRSFVSLFMILLLVYLYCTFVYVVCG